MSSARPAIASTENERDVLEAATLTGLLVTCSSFRRLRAAWRASCQRRGIVHLEALHHVNGFELRVDFCYIRHGVTAEARQQIDNLIAQITRNGGAGPAGAYAPDVPPVLLGPLTRAILGNIEFDQACRGKNRWR
jgi:hypothetical protein